ncbi:hypothetical protein FLA_5803 [Filimonas lacunae]|nr:hypothetical protein FLA_5803 [Filimonas lacunae]
MAGNSYSYTNEKKAGKKVLITFHTSCFALKPSIIMPVYRYFTMLHHEKAGSPFG